jgi:phosphoribosylformylglycinamidine (FGAM) synthase PurS component
MAKTNNETALESVNVNNNITLNLNQNDLIELAIQEKLGLLEPAIQTLETSIQEVGTKHVETVREIITKFIMKKVKSSDIYKDLDLIAKLFNTFVKVDISWSNVYNDTSIKNNIVGKYNEISLSTVEEYKDPFAYAKRNAYNREYRVLELDTITVTLSLQHNTSLNLNQKIVFNDVNTPKEYLNECINYGKNVVKMYDDLYNLKMSYLEYKYGEKRIKSKLVKASLSKSSEGKAILDMLSQATNVKFIQ